MNIDLVWILISAMVVNNFTLFYFLGLCPFMGVSGRVETAIRMGAANIFVLTITAICAWFLNTYILPHAPYLRLISFIVVNPTLFRQLGIYLPLITTNCAILGFAIFATNKGYGFLQGLSYALGAGLGLTLALVLMASIRESSELAEVPRVAKGTALIFIIAGCLSLAFQGFAGLLSSS
jgi:electron transport complex protein RnfA